MFNITARTEYVAATEFDRSSPFLSQELPEARGAFNCSDGSIF